MKWIAKIFRLGTRQSTPQFDHSQLAVPLPVGNQTGTSSRTNVRRELLKVVLRDTLIRHGIPSKWVVAEVLTSTSRTGATGTHLRLVVKHWEPRLLHYAIPLQRSLLKRARIFDPLSTNWLTGISWRFELTDESGCPDMPHPGSWTASPTEPVPAVTPAPVRSQGLEVIEGPVRITDPSARRDWEAEVRADLEQLRAIRSADAHQHSTTPRDPFQRTEPMKLR
ncbi:hypothetical protein GCM10027034_36870 [Ramlibacter solisilvae]|uniref:hypothetical protein n=1 Tax=Ramlibacter tataouinensis TaxID=94132 RepID=UPI0011AE1C22|nr:hypothetical protein [Ramlibacter tataouinensis]